MKLIFSKDDENEINVKIQKGTIEEDFSYIEMLKQLLNSNPINEVNYGNLSDLEKEKLENMIKEIGKVFEKEDEILQ